MDTIPSRWRLSRALVLFAIVWLPCAAAVRGPAQQTRPAPVVAAPVAVIIASPPASTWKQVAFEPVAESEQGVGPYVEMLRAEMSLYPERLIIRSELRAIVVVRNLCVEGQARAVVPDEPRRLIFVDPFVGSAHPVYQRHALHHDFFHYLAARWEGDAYFSDPAWVALNPPGAAYGNGGKNAREGNQYAMTHPAPGFVNLYSQSAVEEDMAEVFAVLQVPEERRLLEQWMRDDEVLRAKVQYIQRFIARHVEPEPAEAGAQTSGEADAE